MEVLLMMKKEALERQSTSYLVLLEEWELIRWKRRLELLNETTDDLWSIREVLKERESNPIFLKAKLNAKYGVIAFPRDEDK
jgi:hypothetical protein